LTLPFEVGCQRVGDGRDELEALDALATDQIGQRLGIEQDPARASDQGAAGGQGADPVAGEDVEGETGGLEVAERWLAKVIGGLPGGGDREQAAMRDHAPFDRPVLPEVKTT
jgi:hypothetical protein